MTMRLTAAALATVVLGAIIGYGLGSTRQVGVLWTVGLAAMLVGTAVLLGVLIRTMTGLRRVTARRRREPAVPAPRVPEQTGPPERVHLAQISSSDMYRNGAAVRRFRDGDSAADDGGAVAGMAGGRR